MAMGPHGVTRPLAVGHMGALTRPPGHAQTFNMTTASTLHAGPQPGPPPVREPEKQPPVGPPDSPPPIEPPPPDEPPQKDPPAPDQPPGPWKVA